MLIGYYDFIGTLLVHHPQPTWQSISVNLTAFVTIRYFQSSEKINITFGSWRARSPSPASRPPSTAFSFGSQIPFGSAGWPAQAPCPRPMPTTAENCLGTRFPDLGSAPYPPPPRRHLPSDYVRWPSVSAFPIARLDSTRSVKVRGGIGFAHGHRIGPK